MFENTTPPSQPQNPLNPVMPSAGMPSPQVPTPGAPTPFAPAQAPVHTMPERFRSAGPAPTGGPKGSGATKKLVVILVVVVGVAGLGVAGLYIFNKVVKNSNNANTNVALTNVGGTNLNTAETNLNTSVNTNLNTSTTNGNENTNLAAANTNSTAGNANTVANSNTNTVANTNSSSTTTPLPSSADTDADGLTNVEETVYGTDATNADTDGDTFLDGMQVRPDGTVIGELGNLYNPKGTGQLEGSSLVKRIQNSAKSYGLLVPTNWTTNESSGLLVITPTVQTGEFFQVRTYDNATGQTPTQWYQANNPQAQMSQVKTSNSNGLETLTSEDGSTVYFFKDTKVYGLTYTNGGLSQLNYWTTMAMMMKSFKLVAS